MKLKEFSTKVYKKKIEKPTANCSHFPFMLKAPIETAESNSNGHRNGDRFNKNMKDFATYICMMCGRAFYDTLSAKSPIPKSNTICMHLKSLETSVSLFSTIILIVLIFFLYTISVNLKQK